MTPLANEGLHKTRPDERVAASRANRPVVMAALATTQTRRSLGGMPNAIFEGLSMGLLRAQKSSVSLDFALALPPDVAPNHVGVLVCDLQSDSNSQCLLPGVFCSRCPFRLGLIL